MLGQASLRTTTNAVLPGRQILALETTKSILTSKIAEQETRPDRFNREPFSHAALHDVDKLSYLQPSQIMNIEKIARFATDVGLAEVTRWKPKMVRHFFPSKHKT